MDNNLLGLLDVLEEVISAPGDQLADFLPAVGLIVLEMRPTTVASVQWWVSSMKSRELSTQA